MPLLTGVQHRADRNRPLPRTLPRRRASPLEVCERGVERHCRAGGLGTGMTIPATVFQIRRCAGALWSACEVRRTAHTALLGAGSVASGDESGMPMLRDPGDAAHPQ